MHAEGNTMRAPRDEKIGSFSEHSVSVRCSDRSVEDAAATARNQRSSCV